MTPGVITPGNAKHPSMADGNPRKGATCRECPARWTGHRAAHCAACHETFTGVSTFDMHRNRGRCHNPAGITRNGNPVMCRNSNGTWRENRTMPARAVALRQH